MFPHPNRMWLILSSLLATLAKTGLNEKRPGNSGPSIFIFFFLSYMFSLIILKKSSKR
jgi:hypothetical protein